MSASNRPTYAVPTHLEEREPFAFGRTVGEVAKLVLVGFVVARLIGSQDVAPGLRLPAAAAVLVIGAAWALVRIQRRPLDAWLGLALGYGATPRRRVWRAGTAPAVTDAPGEHKPTRGWCELERVRVRWADGGTRHVQGSGGAPAVQTRRGAA